MDKLKIGIPRALNYYHYKDLWINFFKALDCDIIISPPTNKAIIKDGLKYANDEMCLSLKIYLGHVSYLKDRCDYILIPRIDNYGLSDQTCTNFLSLFDIVNNIFNVKILNYNIDYCHGENEISAFINMGKVLHKKRWDSIKAYQFASVKANKECKKKVLNSFHKLKSDQTKVLLIGHSYNLHDAYLGQSIIYLLESLGIEVIMSDGFDPKMTNKLASSLSPSLYFKYSKEAIGTIDIVRNNIDGIIFLTAFPCGPDSLVNELVFRKITLPYLNLVIDDIDSLTGIETRIESFVDIIEQKKQLIN
ncbi:MAG: acyl-CoA dehydratase activase-related protein [Bacilli bacterium]|nr:acyl-CoA dehydratase activase-related protein [Bacilli bacterium]